jgi:hypothetical protein
MVICYVLGGLGNQMFQYAAGRALSLSIGSPLLLDLSGFENYALHNGFEIDRVFCAPVNTAVTEDVRQLLGWRASKLTLKLLKRVQSHLLRGPHLVIEPYFNYWAGLRQVDKPSYLMGYWQSEKYFRDFEQNIRSDFSFSAPLDGENLATSIYMQGCNSVSIHVRRGDYVTHAPTAKILNVCTLEYYQKAIKLIVEKIPSPQFFIFSDDQHWVRNNLNIPFPTEYIDRNRGRNSYIDMQLMSSCKHQIMANSSFSWWGAWLNVNPDKIVIAPRNWFCNGINDDDLIPQQWTRL